MSTPLKRMGAYMRGWMTAAGMGDCSDPGDDPDYSAGLVDGYTARRAASGAAAMRYYGGSPPMVRIQPVEVEEERRP